MLKGMFFLHTDDSCYQTGQIVEDSDGVLLLELDVVSENKGPPLALVPFAKSELVQAIADDGGFKFEWGLFRTREDLDVYLIWMCETATEVDEDPKPVSQLN